MRNTIWQFATAQNLQFGRGCRQLLASQLRRHQVRRPLIITDANIAGTAIAASWLDDLQAEIPLTIFDQCQAEPSVAIAVAACEAGRGAEVDGVIGLGGGSNMDVAKVAATVLRHGGQPLDYSGFDRIPAAVLPLFALPTTAGTGSEVSHSAVLTDSQAQIKVSILSPWLRPTCALVDPELTDSCPPHVTAHSGIDALVHAIEAYSNRDFSQMAGIAPQARAYEGSYPLTRMLALEAIRLIGRSLVAVYQRPQDTAARDDMALAATLAGMAFSNSGVGIVHALEYPIGALTHCGHGEGNGLLLPHVMRYNLAVCHAQYAEIAAVWLGEQDSETVAKPSAEGALEIVEELLDKLGITRRLRDFGMRATDIGAVAAKAFEIKRLLDVNRQAPRLQDLETIVRSAF